MSRSRKPRRIVIAAAALAVGVASLAAAAPRYGVGRAASAAEVAGWDIDVRPDGRGLPAGRGSVAQGQSIYDAKCASCHGTFGESNDYMALAGGVGTLASDRPIRTTGSKLNYATTLFDYIRRAMPFNAPKSLSDDEVYALTAYVLNLNDILPAEATLDRESILRVKMPNQDGFTTKHGLATRSGTPDTHASACMRDCAASVRVASQIPDYARGSHGDLAKQSGHWKAARDDAAPSSTHPVSTSSAELATRAGCLACHGVTKPIVGPAFADVARRYHDEAGAQERLMHKVTEGGGGSWGAVPMPAQAHVAANDLQAIVSWILTLP